MAGTLRTPYVIKINGKIYENLFTEGTNIISELEKKTFDRTLVNNSTDRHRVPNRNKTNNDVTVHLDNTFSKIDIVPGLRTSLFPHQKTVVKAMLDLEYYRNFTMFDQNVGFKIAYNAAVLSEPVGSGKTVDILALLCLSKIPRAVPDITPMPLPAPADHASYIRRKFKMLLRPTIIFVGISVMKQWERAIKIFTDLKPYCINTVKELKPFLNMISNRLINDYDIILVKNGRITVPITLPDGIELEPKNRVEQPYIYNIISNLRNYCWARVVVDDFDTIRLPYNASIVNGIFTWYISSTRKKMEFRSTGRNMYNSTADIITNQDYGCAGIMYNHFLFNVLNVRNDPEYSKEIMSIPNPKFHIATFINLNDKYISLLDSIGGDNVNRIIEMLNGDAINTAAEAAGIKSTSVADIFENILGDNYKKYRFAGDILEFIEYQISKEPTRKSMSENPDPKDKYGKRDLLDFRDIEYRYPGVNTLLKETLEEYKDIKKNTGMAIQRVKDNIKHGKCPVCRKELDETEDIIIIKCCSAVFCGVCGIEAQNLKDRSNQLINGRCSNCRSQVNIKDLIYIGDGFDLDKITDEDFEQENELISKEKRTGKDRTKYTAIIDIINGVPLQEDKRVDMHIPNMMKGNLYLPEAKIRKVLIFASFDETLKEVVKVLKENNIRYWYLIGSSSEIDNTSNEFTMCTEACALVINSTRHCSGLNFQTATDLVFTHRMIDPAVESQVAGRGHRIGRTSPLNIWYLTYNTEATNLIATHSVRILSESELKEEADNTLIDDTQSEKS